MKKLILIVTTIAFFSCTNSNNKSTEQPEKFFEKKDNVKQETNKSANFDTTQLAKTAELLDENLYWGIIEKSLKSTNNQYEQQHFLIKEISNLTPKEMIGFRLRTDKLLYDTYNSEMWCAGYIMNGGCSDDGFEYFRNWIISRGKETYYKAKENPDNLISEVNKNLEMYEFESFWYVALEAFKNKTSKDLYNYIDEENFKTKEGHYPQIKFTWQEEKPESMKKICPQLFKMLWQN